MEWAGNAHGSDPRSFLSALSVLSPSHMCTHTHTHTHTFFSSSQRQLRSPWKPLTSADTTNAGSLSLSRSQTHTTETSTWHGLWLQRYARGGTGQISYRRRISHVNSTLSSKWSTHLPTSTHPLTHPHPPTHSPLNHSPTHPLTHPHPPTHSPLTHSPTHSLTHSPLTHSLTHQPIHPLTHSPTHSPPTHSPTHSLTHPPTHPLTRSQVERPMLESGSDPHQPLQEELPPELAIKISSKNALQLTFTKTSLRILMELVRVGHLWSHISQYKIILY